MTAWLIALAGGLGAVIIGLIVGKEHDKYVKKHGNR